MGDNNPSQCNEVTDDAMLVLNAYLQISKLRQKTASAPPTLNYNVQNSPNIKPTRSLNGGQIYGVNNLNQQPKSSKKKLGDKIKDQFLSVLRNKSSLDKNKNIKTRKSIDLKKVFSIKMKKKHDKNDEDLQIDESNLIQKTSLRRSVQHDSFDILDAPLPAEEIGNLMDHVVPPPIEEDLQDGVPFDEKSLKNRDRLITYAAELLDRIADDIDIHYASNGRVVPEHQIVRSTSSISLQSLSSLVGRLLPDLSTQNFDDVMHRYYNMLHGSPMQQLATLFAVGRRVYLATNSEDVASVQNLILDYFRDNFADHVANLGGWAGLIRQYMTLNQDNW